jgi:hypothetical protein
VTAARVRTLLASWVGVATVFVVQATAQAETPDWLQRWSSRHALAAVTMDARAPAYLLLQEDRPDGTELVTVRYRLDDSGALRTYAGAGLNRSSYFDDEGDVGPALLVKRARHSTYGAAAEVGAEVLLNDRTRVTADLRWADLDGRAEVLRAEHGPVAAEPLLLGLSLAWRFR